MPDDQGSVTRWLDAAKGGGETAARELWRRYFETLVRLARARLRASPRTAEDEEDVALSALDSFLDGAARGRFPRLDDRHDLWRILVTITTRKAVDQVQRHRRQKRGGGRVFGASPPDGMGMGAALGDIPGAEPTPEFAAMVADECRCRLDGLRDETLRRIALLKMEGYTNEEVAGKLGCGLRTVVRKLELIRKAWTAEESS
jgi:DNA-directed RNA polymerase specialized sigma24 family protein